jgi:hypothetical protein
MSDIKNDNNEDIDRDPVFYYSREKRLMRAPYRVREFNEENKKKQSLTSAFFGTKGNLLVFASIILAFAMVGITSRFPKNTVAIKLGGNNLTVTILHEEDVLILGITKNAGKSIDTYSGEVDIAVSPVMSKSDEEIPPVFMHRIFFHPVNLESYRISLPFSEKELLVILKTENEQKIKKLKTNS